MRPRASTALLAVATTLAVACGGPRPPAPPETAAVDDGTYRATIRWTSFEVPHVVADDLGSLGFGQGWVSARQHLCRLADELVRVRGERARWFGPGDGDAHLDSDFFHLHLGLDARALSLAARQSPDARAIAQGWVAGYNHYVRTTPPSSWPAPCRDAPWVQPIDELDLARLGLALATIASSRRFEAAIARAAPAGARTGWAPAPEPGEAAVPASNGWAIGGDRTESGGGIVVANPHFPWEGELTFSEIHLTARGDLDVYGAGIPGVPMVGIGFTRDVAWTHTFSSSARFLIARLRLVDGDPLTYVRDDGTAPITRTRYEIAVRQPDGTLGTARRTLYRTEHGPILVTPQLPWSADAGTAFALRDVALDSAGSVIDLYLGFARAGSVEELRRALAHRATPFLNTLAADRHGDAWYVDGSAVPNLTERGLAAWEIARRAVAEVGAAWRLGVPVVDGSMSLFDPVIDDPDAPYAVPLAEAPELLRRDYVFNANDSYGYTNPAAPLSGFSPLYGDPERTPSPRSLMNLRLLRDKGPAAPAGPDGRFSIDEAARAILSNRSFTGEQLRDEVLRRCRAADEARRAAAAAAAGKTKARGKGKAKGPGAAKDAPAPAPDLGALCTRLAEWDLRFGVASRGAILWRETMAQLGAIDWVQPFDPAAPSTPSGLGAADVVAALERAADLLASQGIDVRARSVPLGEVQRAAIGSRAGVPGGDGLDGVASVVTWRPWNGSLLPAATRAPPASPTGLGPDGYPINYGQSWIMVVELGRGGPEARVLMTYGPPGPAGEDPLELLARGELRPARFDPDDIAADPALVVEEVSAPRSPR